MHNQRCYSYGERRIFSCIEKIAIRQRVKVAEKVLKIIYKTKRNATVLELGCGFFGYNLLYLKSRFPQMHFIGVDLKCSSDIDNIELIEYNIEHWKPDTKFDCVLSLAVIEHLLDLQAHFQLISLSLSDDGFAVITTPTPYAHIVLKFLSYLGIFDKREINDHKLYLTKTGITALAEKYFLEIIEFRYLSLGLNQLCILKKALIKSNKKYAN